jgi:midasin (ATPase involved in ribosome maturation)
MPDEVEVEEDLGPVEDEAVPELEDNQFDIEIIQDDFGDRASDDEDAEEEEAKEEEAEEAKEEVSHPPKRKENTMVGGVRKGKYVQ